MNKIGKCHTCDKYTDLIIVEVFAFDRWLVCSDCEEMFLNIVKEFFKSSTITGDYNEEKMHID